MIDKLLILGKNTICCYVTQLPRTTKRFSGSIHSLLNAQNAGDDSIDT